MLSTVMTFSMSAPTGSVVLNPARGFDATANQLVFDNVTFGKLTVPTSLALLGAALVAASLSRRRRYRTNWSTNAAPRPTST